MNTLEILKEQIIRGYNRYVDAKRNYNAYRVCGIADDVRLAGYKYHAAYAAYLELLDYADNIGVLDELNVPRVSDVE